MSTRAENIAARLDEIALELAEMGPTKAGGLPDSEADAARVAHIRYRMSLVNEAKELEAWLERASGTFEYTSSMSAGW